MNDIVQISNVTKTYAGGITAVDDLSLTVRDGEFVTLLGPSGCGKTTTLRMIAGFELPDTGQIKIDNEDVTDLPPYERKVNTVFQDYALFPHMNINDNVGYGLRVGGMPKSEIKSAVREALGTVGLLDKANARPANLSGGQKQRVALARALVRKPKVLLLDEPLSALDAKLREAMQVELKHLHQQSGITFVFVTHDQKEALVMSDRIVVMHNGKIVQAGTPSELYDKPASPYVADFIGSSNKLYGAVTQTSGDEVIVQCGAHAIRGMGDTQRLSMGDKVVVTVRPEKVVLLTGGADMFLKPNQMLLEGIVREVLFHGSSCRLKADIGDQKLFDVDVQLQSSLDSSGILNVGVPIKMAVNIDSVSVFPIEEDAL